MSSSKEYNRWYGKYKRKNKQASKKNVRLIRDEAKKGGCVLCGYNKCSSALDFHHVGDKSYDFRDAMKSIPRFKNELQKCIVVCANCHREIHAGQIEGYENYQRAYVPESNDMPLLRLIENG